MTKWTKEQKQIVERRQKNQAPTKVSPTISQMETITVMSIELGITPPEPATEAEARFVIDDLRHQQRKARRRRA